MPNGLDLVCLEEQTRKAVFPLPFINLGEINALPKDEFLSL